MRIKMVVSSTDAAKGRIITRNEREAKRLIEAGYAIPYEDGSLDERLSALEERLTAVETAVAKIPEGAVSSPPENQQQKPPEKASQKETKKADKKGGK